MKDLKEGQEERIREAVKTRIREYSETGRDLGFMTVISPAFDNEMEHIVNIGTSILCTKWGVGYPGGSFVQSIVDNNLMETFGRADHANLKAIGFYVYLIYNQGYVE
jgi:hypothetical protein